MEIWYLRFVMADVVTQLSAPATNAAGSLAPVVAATGAGSFRHPANTKIPTATTLKTSFTTPPSVRRLTTLPLSREPREHYAAVWIYVARGSAAAAAGYPASWTRGPSGL